MNWIFAYLLEQSYTLYVPSLEIQDGYYAIHRKFNYTYSDYKKEKKLLTKIWQFRHKIPSYAKLSEKKGLITGIIHHKKRYSNAKSDSILEGIALPDPYRNIPFDSESMLSALPLEIINEIRYQCEEGGVPALMYKCWKCKNVWIAKRKKSPKRCPKCGNLHWNQSPNIVICERCGHYWRKNEMIQATRGYCPMCKCNDAFNKDKKWRGQTKTMKQRLRRSRKKCEEDLKEYVQWKSFYGKYSVRNQCSLVKSIISDSSISNLYSG